MTYNVSCVELGKLSAPGIRVKVRWFPGDMTAPRLWRAPSNILTLSQAFGGPIQRRNVGAAAPGFSPSGPLTFRPRSTVWESRTNGSRVLAVSLYLEGDIVSLEGGAPSEGMAVDDFSILEMMRILHDEARAPGEASEQLVGAIGTALRIKLTRRLGRATPRLDQTRLDQTRLDQTRLDKARLDKAQPSCVDLAMIGDLIKAAGAPFPTAAALAEQRHMSGKRFRRLFRSATGKTPSRYFDDARLEKAKVLLAASSMTLKQISYEAGYSTASHFSSRFRRVTGLTPSAFRGLARQTA